MVLKLSSKQTENSHFAEKVELRKMYTKNGDLVFDAYSADGKIWNEIQKKFDVKVLRIEKEKHKKGIYLCGDNIKFMMSIDLSKYDIIDLDAFGIPYQQLKIAIKKAKKGCHIFVTFIQTMYGGLPTALLEDIGYSRVMVKKVPSLFYRKGFEKLKFWLAVNGIEDVDYYRFGRKIYLHFVK